MSPAQRFTFDREFGHDGTRAKKSVRAQAHAVAADELEAIKADAFARGRQGRRGRSRQAIGRAARRASTRELGALVERAGRRHATGPRGGDQARAISSRASSPQHAGRGALADRDRGLDRRNASRSSAASRDIVIRVHAGLARRRQGRSRETCRKEQSFTGRVLVIGEPQIAAGNCTHRMGRWRPRARSRHADLRRGRDHTDLSACRRMNDADVSDRPSPPEEALGTTTPVDGGK